MLSAPGLRFHRALAPFHQLYVGPAHPAVGGVLESGRLARPGVLLSGDCAREGHPTLVLSGAQYSGQSVEELPDPFSDDRLSGDASSDFSFEGFLDPQTCSEALLSHDRLHVLSRTSWGDVVHVCAGSGGTSPHALSSAVAECGRLSPLRSRASLLGRLLPV